MPLKVLASSVLIVAILCPLIEGQEVGVVRFRLQEGAMLGHHWGAPGSVSCLTGGFNQVTLSGTFDLKMDQNPNRTGGMIENVDFTSTTGPAYHVGGDGVLSISRLDDSASAEPPNETIVILHIVVNDSIKGTLEFDPPGAITTQRFPILRWGLQTNPPTKAGDCFLFAAKAEPVPEDAIRFFRRGDVDGNGKRDITDPIVTLNHLFAGEAEPSCADAQDCNDDGTVDVADAICVLNYLFQGGELPPIPSTFCGIDPTEDELDCQGQPACMPEGT